MYGCMKQIIKSSRTLPATTFIAALAMTLANHSSAANLKAGSEIVFTDSQSAILKADMASGASAVVTSGQKLSQPFGITVGKNGEFFVTDTGCNAVLGVQPQTGIQRVVSCNGILGAPFGITTEASGAILVANAQA